MEQISRRALLAALGAAGSTALTACAEDEPPVEIGSTTHTPAGGGDPVGGSGGDEGPSSSGPTSMVPVDLASPDDLRDRWAAYAAMWVGAGVSEGGTGPRATDGDWVYEMEIGQWGYLVRLEDGRAVLAGQSNPDTRRDAAAEKRNRETLLGQGPSWWGVVDDVLPATAHLGFVIGWDGKRWTRSSAAPTGGGYDSFVFYVATAKDLGQILVRWGSNGQQEYTGTGGARAAADTVMAQGTRVTSSQLRRLGPGMRSSRLPAATAAARAFEGRGRH
ncbi:hypothetical protein N5P18_05800 [Janibacter terrae]|uniref:Tat pathway signal sequence domain protein n=1 Tax=Janibacter terrae TaxID=103817 RepID=A0ABZ2FJA4_9MICO